MTIRLDNVGHSYRNERWLFRHLSLTIMPSEITAILGPNGTGKTTLLRALCGTLAAREGEVHSGAHVGYVPQALSADQAYSVIEMVLLGRSRFLGRFNTPGRRDAERARECLHEVGMGAIAEQRYDRLSGGQRQLVLLARALASDCRVLVLDEPVSALDLANQGVVLRLIQRLARAKQLSVVFTTHHPDHALGIADKTLLLLRDSQHLYGAAQSVLTEGNLARMYGVPVRRIDVRSGDETASAIVPLHGLTLRQAESASEP